MNSLIIAEILNNYNHKPYYNSDNYISINDDRIGRIVSFKIYGHLKCRFSITKMI